MHEGAHGVKLQENFFFNSENMFFWARKLKKKKGIEENHITAFNTWVN